MTERSGDPVQQLNFPLQGQLSVGIRSMSLGSIFWMNQHTFQPCHSSAPTTVLVLERQCKFFKFKTELFSVILQNFCF